MNTLERRLFVKRQVLKGVLGDSIRSAQSERKGTASNLRKTLSSRISAARKAPQNSSYTR
jgi:hypothetical protein